MIINPIEAIVAGVDGPLQSIAREPPTPMIVCLCEGVSDREIKRVIRSGARSVTEVGRTCGAGTDCGRCKCSVRALLREATPSEVGGEPVVPLALQKRVV